MRTLKKERKYLNSTKYKIYYTHHKSNHKLLKAIQIYSRVETFCVTRYIESPVKFCCKLLIASNDFKNVTLKKN